MPSHSSTQRSWRWIGTAAVLLLLVGACRGTGPAPCVRPAVQQPAGARSVAPPDPVEALADGLGSANWEERLDTLRRLSALGPAANDVVLPVLRDANEVVRKAAQNHFVGLGEAAVPYLVERLVAVEEDAGFFARIAGGTERNEVKSLAGTLWLALVRGTPRGRVYAITKELIAHASPRIRAVGLFTAATLRDARYLRLVEPLANDPDPMLRERLWASLTLLLVKRSGSAPDLDEPTAALTLTLLEPELVPLLSSEKLGALDRAQTFGDVLGRASVPASLEPRLRALLNAAVADDRLSARGAARAGAILARQPEEQERARAFQDAVAQIEPERRDAFVVRQLAALSSFRSAAYDLEALPRLLDLADALTADERLETYGLPTLAGRFLARALAEGKEEAAQRAMTSLARWIAHPDPQLSLQAARAHAMVLGEIRRVLRRTAEDAGAEAKRAAYEGQRAALLASARAHADALFARAASLPLQEVNRLLELFVHLDDERRLDLFELVWSQRWSDEPGMNSFASRAVLILSARQEKAILPHLLKCAESPEGPWHRSLRDLCAYALGGNSRYGPFLPEYLTAERLERWVRIIEDPGLYHRTRAGFFSIMQADALPPEQRKVLADLALKYTAAPHDSNLRSKSMLSLAYTGDRRVLGPIYAMLLETDHPWWIWENIVPALAVLHGAPVASGDGDLAEGPIPRPAMEALVDLLEAQLAAMAPYDEVRFAYSHNYYSWGVEYLMYPPDVTALFLKIYTRQDFGLDVARWRTWMSSQGEILGR